MATSDNGGVSLPDDAAATIAAATAAATPAPAATATPSISTSLAVGVTGMPIDASTWIQITIPANASAAVAVPSVSITLTARILLADGTLSYCRWDKTFAMNAGLTYSSDMAPGYLLSVAVTCNTPGVVDGMLFAVVGLIHQPGTGFPLDTVLVSSYVSYTAPAAWPGGHLHTVSEGEGFYFEYEGTNPPAGSAWTYTVVDQYLMPQLIAFEFVTSSTAANRYPYIELTLPPMPPVYIGVAPVAQTASQSWYWNFGVELAWESGAPVILECLPLQSGLLLNPGAQLGVNCYQLQSGDEIVNPVIIGRAWV